MRIEVKKQSISKPTRCPQCASLNSFDSSTDGGNPVWKCRVPECQYTLPIFDTRTTPAQQTVTPNRIASSRDAARQIAERNHRARRERLQVASVVTIIIGVIGLLIAFSVGVFGKASVETTIIALQWYNWFGIVGLPILAGVGSTFLFFIIYEGDEKYAMAIGSIAVLLASIIGFIYCAIIPAKQILSFSSSNWLCFAVLPIVGIMAFIYLFFRIGEVILDTWEYVAATISLIVIMASLIGYIFGGVVPVASANRSNDAVPASITSTASISPETPNANTSTPPSSSAPTKSSLPATAEPVWQRFERDNGYFYGYSDSLTSGYVEYHYDSGSIYKGKYKDTDGNGFVEQNGEGEYITEDYTYKGNFLYDEFDGYGEITWKNGDVYKGEWKNGERVGTGEYYWANGDWYISTFVLDDNTYIDGNGIYKRGKLIYEGTFTAGNLNGAGKLYTSDSKIIYDGNFKEDKFYGKGTYYFPNSGGRFTYEDWDLGETEVMYLTTDGVRTECGQWLHNDFYGMVYENNKWVSVEIVDGVKSYTGDYSWMLNN